MSVSNIEEDPFADDFREDKIISKIWFIINTLHKNLFYTRAEFLSDSVYRLWVLKYNNAKVAATVNGLKSEELECKLLVVWHALNKVEHLQALQEQSEMLKNANFERCKGLNLCTLLLEGHDKGGEEIEAEEGDTQAELQNNTDRQSSLKLKEISD